MPYNVKQYGWKINGQKVAEKSPAKNHKDQHCCVLPVVNLGHVGLLNIVLGEVPWAQVCQFVNLKFVERT